MAGVRVAGPRWGSKTRYSQVTARRWWKGVSAERRMRKSQSSEYSSRSSKPPTLR